MTIKREITEFHLVLADGSIHTLANCNPGNVECISPAQEVIKPTWAANDWKEMFQLPLDCTVEVAFDTNTRLYSILSKGLGWAVLHLRQDNKLYSWQIFLKSATDSAIQFILLSKETVTDLDKPLLDRATDAITVLERGLRHN